MASSCALGLWHHAAMMAEADLAPGWWFRMSAGPTLHLAHANGFPPGIYRHFAEAMAERYRVLAALTLPLRPGTVPSAVTGWEALADDLGRQLQTAGLVFQGASGGHRRRVRNESRGWRAC